MTNSIPEQKVPLPSRKEWLSHYQAWEKTSMSKVKYCKAHGLNAGNFYYWCHQIEKVQQEVKSPPFIPLIAKSSLSTEKAEQMTVELLLPGDIRLKVELKSSMLLTFIKELSDATAIIR